MALLATVGSHGQVQFCWQEANWTPYSIKAGPCSVFNTGGTHGKRVLTAEGKCKYDHVCDHWVSDKGPKGRCLSTEHERGECDNPSKCAQPVQ